MNDMFLCPRMPGGLRLSTSSCAISYQHGKVAESWETAHICQGCQIGARHAGEQVPAVVEKPRYQCRSCGDTSYRLVCGLICVSCYNRMAEAIKSRNARGKTPIKWRVASLPFGTFVYSGLFQYYGRTKITRITRNRNYLLPQLYLWDAVDANS